MTRPGSSTSRRRCHGRNDPRNQPIVCVPTHLVSAVLGLAWEDLNLAAGTAQIRRGAASTPSVGMVLGSTKTSGAEGVYHLAHVSVAHLRCRRAEQQLERAAMGAE